MTRMKRGTSWRRRLAQGSATRLSPRLSPRLSLGSAAAFTLLGLALGCSVATGGPGDSPEPAATTEAAPGEQDAKATSPAELRECVVILTDGRLVRGLFVGRGDDGTVTVRVGGVETSFAPSSVSDLQVLAPVRERYEEMRAAIAPDDVSSRVALVEWLRERELYDEALVEVDAVLELEPFHPQARRHKQWLEAQIELRNRANRPIKPARKDAGEAGQDDTGDGDAGSGGRGGGGTARQRWAEFPLLTADEVNIIRVYEVDLARPPRMRIERKTIEALLRDYGRHDAMPQTPGERAALFDRPAADILELMFRVKARELYGQVRVLEDPPSMETFRRSIAGRAGWLVNACSTVQCHGGQDAGRLVLTGRRANSDEAVYTNFFTLDQHRLPDGTALIDYAEPARSPLLHMGVRRENSLFPHPVTDKARDRWRPVFVSPDDPRFKQAAEWIRSLYRPRPDYGIAWQAPGLAESSDGPSDAGGVPIDRSGEPEAEPDAAPSGQTEREPEDAGPTGP